MIYMERYIHLNYPKYNINALSFTQYGPWQALAIYPTDFIF